MSLRDDEPAGTDPDTLQEALTAILFEGWGPSEVSGLRRLSGGASRETWYLVAESGGARRELVLRRDPQTPGDAAAMDLEAQVLRAAAGAGVPVPTVVSGGGDREILGTPYLLMDYVPGETIPRRLLRDEQFAAVRPRLAGALGEIAARIHTVRLADAQRLEGATALVAPLASLQGLQAAFPEPRPAVELGLRWLSEHPPPARADVLVHGDLRNGNLLVDRDGVRAVLDWELAHAGNPVEDLGWLCVKSWRFGSPNPVGGFGDRDALLDGYERIAGWRPSTAELHWWEVYGTVRWALIARRQADRFISGVDRGLEYAVLGRRVCEQEFDLLLVLGHLRPTSLPDVLSGPGPSAPPPHDPPGADGLLAAVHDFLVQDQSGPDERRRFHARVAANAVRIARREGRLVADHAARHDRRLEAAGCVDDAQLVERLRVGDLSSVLLDAVIGSVLDKLAVANPAYADQPG